MNHHDLQVLRIDAYITELQEVLDTRSPTPALEALADALDAALERWQTDTEYTPSFEDA